MIELSRQGRVATVTLNRAPVNAINLDLIASFHSVLDELEGDGNWAVLHIRSAERVFAAGADLEQIRGWKEAASPSKELSEYIHKLQELYLRIECIPQVTLCEISGAALGGGLELALACDFRVVASSAKIGLPEVGLGLIPAGGGTQRLTRLIGKGLASRLIFLGEIVRGDAAVSLGIAQWSFADELMLKETEALCIRLSEMPSHAIAVAKGCIAGFYQEETDGYVKERIEGGALLESRETLDLISEFLDKNK